MFGAKKEDIGTEKYAEMLAYVEHNDEMPDGAFFAMAQEQHGWEIDDWGWFAEVQELNDN